MKTIALKEKTFFLIKELKEKNKINSFDEMVLSLVQKNENIEHSLFGSLKGKTKKFNAKERKKLWGDKNRE